MTSPICCTMTGARPSVGSSSSSSVAPVRRMRAIASICCSPPESCVPWLRAALLAGWGTADRSRRAPCRPAAPPAAAAGSPRRRGWRRCRAPRGSRRGRAARSGWTAARSARGPPKRIEPVRCSTMPMIGLQRRRLAGAVAAEQRHHLALAHARGRRRAGCATRRRRRARPRAAAPRARRWPLSHAVRRVGPHVRLAHLGVARTPRRSCPRRGSRPRCSTVMMSDRSATTDRLCSTISTVRSARHPADQLGDPADVLVAHARRRLVEQHQLRARARAWWRSRARACGHRAARPRRCAAKPVEPDRVEQLHARARCSASRLVSERQKWNEVPSARCSATRTFSSTREVREHRRDLERAHHAPARQVGRLGAR